MKTKIGAYEVEGTPEEIQQFIKIQTTPIVEALRKAMVTIAPRKKFHHKRPENSHKTWTKDEDFIINAQGPRAAAKSLLRTVGACKTRYYATRGEKQNE